VSQGLGKASKIEESKKAHCRGTRDEKNPQMMTTGVARRIHLSVYLV